MEADKSYKKTEGSYKASNGGVIAYSEVKGRGNIALLLIHGMGMCRDDYAMLYEELSKDFHIFSIDMFGHGDSSKSKEFYTCAAGGQAIAELITDIIKQPVILAGHSIGGVLAAYIAGIIPEMVKGLLIEDPPFFTALPGELENSIAFRDTIELMHKFLNQTEEDDPVVYYLRNSLIFNLGGREFAEKTAAEAKKLRKEKPGSIPEVHFISDNILYGVQYFDRTDMNAIDVFYKGSWFGGISQEQILESVKCPTAFLKTKTRYDRSGMLMAASDDEGAAKVMELLDDCKKTEIMCGHDMHFARPEKYMDTLKRLAAKCGLM